MTLNRFRINFAIALCLFGFLPNVNPCRRCFGDDVPLPDEPKVAERSQEGLQAIPGFRIPDDWQCELVAAEPEVANPVAFFIAHDGAIYVCETFRQDNGVTDNRAHNRSWLIADLASRTVQDRIDYFRKLLPDQGASYQRLDDRIRKLSDLDGDGVYELSTVFANRFNRMEEGTGAGVLFHQDTLYYTCIPKLWRLIDTTGDGVADVRESLHDGFGVRVAFRGHDLHGLVLGPDGRLYFSLGDRGYHVETPEGLLADPTSGAVFRCELDGSRLEVFATGLRNPQELAFDDYGNLFTGDNNSDSGDQARWVYVVQGGDSGWRMFYQYLPDRGPFNREKIWHPFHSETPAYVVPPVANVGDGPSGLTYYPGTGLGELYRDTFFMVDFRGQASNSGVRAIQVEPDGAFFKLKSNEQFIWNILATDVDFGPDGGLYISDWVNGWTGEGRGRIYRFQPERMRRAEGTIATHELLRKGVGDESNDTLMMLLQHPDRRVRLESQWELAKRGLVDLLASIALADSISVEHRLHGVWGLGQVARSQPQKSETATRLLLQCLESNHPLLVARACSAISESLSIPDSSAMIRLIKHDDLRVRAAASIAAGRLRIKEAFEPICHMLQENADHDPVVRHAGTMALTAHVDQESVVALKDSPVAAIRRAAVVALRRNRDPRLVAFLTDSDASIVLEAARAIHDLPELEVALPRLAEMLMTLPDDDNLLRRALNANYRVGGPSSAKRIADFAADGRRSDRLRVEAIDLLRKWENPDPLDWITGEYRPLEKRDATAPRDALREKLPALVGGADRVRLRAITVAAELGIDEVVPILTKIIENRSAPGHERADALRGLAAMKVEQARPYISAAISDASPPVRVAAFQLLANIAPDEALPAIRRATKSDVIFERQAAWDVLKKLKSPEADKFLEEGVKLYLAGNLPKDCAINVREAAEGRLSGPTADALRDHLDALSAIQASDPIAAFRDALEGGDALLGRDLFFFRSQLSCVRCHKVAGRGGEVGPDLTRIAATKDRVYLLESIVAPSARIAENYESVVVITEDQLVLTGILRQEDEATLTLMMADGTTQTIDKAGLIARRKGPSSMPDDLMKYLSLRELRDLVAYLATMHGQNDDALLPGESGGHSIK